MVLKKVILIFLILFSRIVSAQIYNEKFFSSGDSSTVKIADVIFDQNGKCIATGYIDSVHQSTFVTKIDLSGNVIWSNKYHCIYNNHPKSMIKTYDGGYSITGTMYWNALPRIFLMHLDSAGNFQWAHTYFNIYGQTALKIIQTRDSGYAIIGIKNHGFYVSFIIKADPSGNLLWSEKLNFSGIGTTLYSILELPDGDFYAVGCTRISDNAVHPMIWKVGQNGLSKKVWLVNNLYGTYWNIKPTIDSGFILTGFVTPVISFGVPYYGSITKLNKFMNIQWTKQLQQYTVRWAYSFEYSIPDSQAYYFSANNYYYGETYIFKTDLTGNIIWSKSIDTLLGNEIKTLSVNGNNLQIGLSKPNQFSLIKTDLTLQNTCFITTALISDSAIILTDTLFSKLHTPQSETDSTVQFTMIPFQMMDSILCLSTSINELKDYISNFYPNPANNKLFISTDAFATENKLIFSLHDLQGREILKMPYFKSSSIDLSSVPDGVYIAVLKGKEKEMRGKVIVQK